MKKKSWNSWDSAWRLGRYDSRLLIICLPIFDRIPDLFFMNCVTIFIHNKTSPNTLTKGVVVRAITLCCWLSWGDEGLSPSFVQVGILCVSLCDSVTTIQIIQFKCTWQSFIPPSCSTVEYARTISELSR